MTRSPVATFVRDGLTREAYTPGEATALRADGWREAYPVALPHGRYPRPDHVTSAGPAERLNAAPARATSDAADAQPAADESKADTESTEESNE